MRKIIGLTAMLALFINCGGSESEVITPKEDKVIAVDDSFQVTEDTVFELNFLSNDTYTQGSLEVNLPTTSDADGILTQSNNKFSYTPIKGFVGVDSFTYTICSTKEEDKCSTATVSITVVDQGSPEAKNDAYTTQKNIEITISDFLENDNLIDDAEFESIDNSSTNGSVTLNSNGTIKYVPQVDFVGNDTFTYTICDDDTTKSCSTATITVTIVDAIAFNIPSELESYYGAITFTYNKEDNYNALKQLTQSKHSTKLSYTDRHDYLYDADEDLSNTANVILMYSGESRSEKEYLSGNNNHSPQTFNTEHVYPKSLLSNSTAEADLHHLRSCDTNINSNRGNLPFIDGTGVYKKDNNAWYPGDEWKGDVARMVFYLNTRYGSSFNNVGSLDLFLKWNKEDPVSDFERQRNNAIAEAQGNRNPFIDNPYLVTLTWGGDSAENTWN
uniref:endonuclease n=1 Tax=uncultured Tenacibaculum sp. TaxID=174713 RepID=UPI002612C5D1|nr:endonuclease [uncultured Tenacibaculum sp.]